MSNQDHDKPDTALDCRPGSEYDEDAFRYFLEVEQARAERSKHPLRVLLATLEPDSGGLAPISPVTAAILFEGLRLSLRETDVIGWYRQHRVAGAVLSERNGTSEADPSSAIQKRVGEELHRRLPSTVARNLRLRVVQLEPRWFGAA
jgi:hypothetical protein